MEEEKYSPKYNKYISYCSWTYMELAIEEIECSEMLNKFNFNWNPHAKTILNLILKWVSITRWQNNMVYQKKLKMGKF